MSAAIATRWGFEACVAHELRTPIAHQRALVEVTLADPDADAATLRAMAERVVASCERQQRLIDALLELVRCESGPTRNEPVDLAVIAAGSLRSHDLRELECDATLEPAPTCGEPDLLEHLVTNLVANAIGHNVPGGRLELATGTDAGHAVVSVANTGPPIAARDVALFFQPFHRSSSSDGVGLGLAIVQAIADAHRATITARARLGGGLRIDLAFPLSTQRSRT